MNPTVFKALFLDALYQVLDNKVFRILAVLTLLPIAFTMVVAFKEDHISILFGIWEITYAELLNSTVGTGMTDEDARAMGLREETIQQLQALIVEGLSGTLGLMLSIAATAFFVPRMLERGTADTLFSKPVSRATLLLARYSAGILFVTFLSIVLVFGMHLGFTVFSGYSDPGFLWGAVTLVYVFALIHGVSVAVAAITRSSIAAILVSLIFFSFGGCAHNIWIAKEQSLANRLLNEERDAERALELADGESAQPAEEPEDRNELLPLIIDIIHYPLPKTTDAGILTQKLRRSVENSSMTFDDPDGELRIALPSSGEYDLRFEVAEEQVLGEYYAEAVYAGRTNRGDEEPVRVTVRRRNALYEPPAEPGGAPLRRDRGLNRTRYVRSLTKELEQRADLGQVTSETSMSTIVNLTQAVLRWSESGRERQLHILTYGESLYEIEFAFAEEIGGESFDSTKRSEVVNDFFRAASMPDVEERTSGNQAGSWYAKQLSFTAPLKFNIFFSVGSSLAFLALMLGLAIWRVRRIDF